MEILIWIGGIISVNLSIMVMSRVLRTQRKIKLGINNATLERYFNLTSHLEQVSDQIGYEEKELTKLNIYNNTPVEETLLTTLRQSIQVLRETKTSLDKANQELYQKALPVIKAREKAAEILRKKREAAEAIRRADAKKKREEEEKLERARRKKREEDERRNRSSYSSSYTSGYDGGSSSSNSSYDGGGGSSSGGGASGDW